jgi:MoaA/NifB/PqqE/SkfB family radical SAM enzyme
MYHLPLVEKWLDGEDIFPVHVEISPSSACNQRCTLCCVDYKGHKAKLLEREILLNLVDDFVETGVKSILLAGEGEPTLNKHIAEMSVKAKNAGIDTALNSNGVLFDESMAEEMLPTLMWSRFTFQAANPKLYSEVHVTDESDFDKAVENVARAAEIKKRDKLEATLGIQQIMIAENAHDIYNVAKLAKDIGMDYFVVKRHSRHPDNKYDVPDNLYEGYVDLMKETETLQDDNFKVIVRWRNFTEDCHRTYDQCIGLPFITQVLANGGIYPCCMFFDNDDLCYGNLHEKSFKEIWLSDRRRDIQKHIKENIDVNKCMSYCRHHSTNQFLSQFHNKPNHINFI